MSQFNINYPVEAVTPEQQTVIQAWAQRIQNVAHLSTSYVDKKGIRRKMETVTDNLIANLKRSVGDILKQPPHCFQVTIRLDRLPELNITIAVQLDPSLVSSVEVVE